jgi:hypothetical protein
MHQYTASAGGDMAHFPVTSETDEMLPEAVAAGIAP